MRKYQKTASHVGPKTVRYIPIRDGDVVELGDCGQLTTSYYASHPRHTLLGFKPGPLSKPAGWIVVLVDEAAAPASRPVVRRFRRPSPSGEASPSQVIRQAEQRGAEKERAYSRRVIGALNRHHEKVMYSDLGCPTCDLQYELDTALLSEDPHPLHPDVPVGPQEPT